MTEGNEAREVGPGGCEKGKLSWHKLVDRRPSGRRRVALEGGSKADKVHVGGGALRKLDLVGWGNEEQGRGKVSATPGRGASHVS